MGTVPGAEAIAMPKADSPLSLLDSHSGRIDGYKATNKGLFTAGRAESERESHKGLVDINFLRDNFLACIKPLQRLILFNLEMLLLKIHPKKTVIPSNMSSQEFLTIAKKLHKTSMPNKIRYRHIMS